MVTIGIPWRNSAKDTAIAFETKFNQSLPTSHEMEFATVAGICSQHPERQGVPCTRCGTFKCPDCLLQGLCEPCRLTTGLQAPDTVDVVGFGRRALARIIDLVAGQLAGFGGGITAAIVLVALEAMGAAAPGWAQRFEHGFLFNMLVGSLASLFGHSVGATISGASLGKALLGLRVARVQGGRAGFKSQFIRELVYFIDGLFFGLVGKSAMDSSPLQQRHGDSWAETVVVRADSAAGHAVASTQRLIVGILVGLAVYSAVLAAGMVLAAR